MKSLIGLLAVMLAPDLSLTSAVNAVDVLDRAIQAHGGLAALQGIKDITREFEGLATNPGQGVRPETPASNTGKVLSIYDSQGQRVLESQTAAARPGAPEQRLMQVITAESGFGANAGLKILARIPPQALPLIRARFQRHQPEGLLLHAAGRPEALRFLGDDTFEGKAQHVIAYADTDGAEVTLSFDAANGLLTKATTVTDDAVAGDTTTDLVFKDYSDENGVKLPHRYQEMLGGEVTRDLRVTSIRINTRPADSLFTVPEDYTTINPAPSQGTVKMADNIYTVQGSYNSMFAVFPDYVVVLEGPLSNGFSDVVLREIQRVAPGKPVKYVVVTHFHFDHISGIRRWVAEGATLVCPPTARQAIERAVAAQHRLHPDALSRNPKAPVFEIVKGTTRVFEGGGVRLEVRDISPVPHVAEMLVGYFPGAHLLYEADMLSIPPTGKLTPEPDTHDFARKIDGWAVDRIIDVHGQRPVTIKEVRDAIAVSI